MIGHGLNEEVRPPACTCGGFQAAGSNTFVLRQFIAHLQDVIKREVSE